DFERIEWRRYGLARTWLLQFDLDNADRLFAGHFREVLSFDGAPLDLVVLEREGAVVTVGVFESLRAGYFINHHPVRLVLVHAGLLMRLYDNIQHADIVIVD